jgi:hypothetical protein
MKLGGSAYDTNDSPSQRDIQCRGFLLEGGKEVHPTGIFKHPVNGPGNGIVPMIRIGDELVPPWTVLKDIVLASKSKFCGVRLEGEIHRCHSSVINFHEIRSDIFALVITFLHVGKVHVPTLNRLGRVLHAASLLQVDSLMAAAAAEMEQQTTPHNCASMLMFADRYNLAELQKKGDVI